MSIIKTITTMIIGPKTLKLCHGPSMPSTIINGTTVIRSEKKKDINGTIPIEVAPNLEEMQRRCSVIRQKEQYRAKIVEALLEQNIQQKSIARLLVYIKKELKEHIPRSVLSVIKHLKLFAKKPSPVHIIAVGFSEKKEAVYNITVDEAHLFYANGFLVSNTDQEDHVYDEVRYGIMARPISPQHAIKTLSHAEKIIKQSQLPTNNDDILSEIFDY
jgi:hypothetical protein